MSFSDHSTISFEKQNLIQAPTGTHKVRYTGEDWDFFFNAPKPVDLSLVLPHHRARSQPIDHHFGMFVVNDTHPMKLKVCRSYCRAKFQLEVRASSSDVTIWLPSDFRGAIHCPRTATFSAGFINRIMENIRLNESMAPEQLTPPDEDEVVVSTSGNVSFRMWDVQTGTPENTHKETFKRLFCCARKSPETAAHDWDFLLEN
ncbi:hypothetical protein FB45DRAFT_803606 [Roridomyces roridus]|uniref:Uncharacterized protein n=1 Tax=Roridomyces roridus TaxID=1738132 RepID=A0AAD7FC50_9AGAR|nr:hypothetical protein FB45DRAFT_803606 [Roridomyces roridus]